MLNRRTFLATAGLATAGAVLALGLTFTPARAEDAAAFIRQTGDQLVQTVNGPDSPAQKQAMFGRIVDQAVDVNAVARFCLGRYWQQATPQQRQTYLGLFRQVLVRNITGKVGEYKGVHYTIGRTVPQGNDSVVDTTIYRPGESPADVQWVVSTSTGSPKIVDVIAEGTSLRLTQRSDYASYMERNGDSIQALLDALRRQMSRPLPG